MLSQGSTVGREYPTNGVHAPSISQAKRSPPIDHDIRDLSTLPTSMAPHMSSRSPQSPLSSPQTSAIMHFPMADIQATSKAVVILQQTDLDHQTVPLEDGDDGSSSLSEIEDRPGNEEPGRLQLKHMATSEGEDTEAETERLEESPQKVREHGNVLLSSPSRVQMGGSTVRKDKRFLDEDAMNHERQLDTSLLIPRGTQVDNINYNSIDQTSDVSSLGDSAEELSKITSPTRLSGKKRKRSSQSLDESDQDNTAKALKRVSAHLASELIASSNQAGLDVPTTLIEAVYPDHVTGGNRLSGVDDAETDARGLHIPKVEANKKGKRKGKKVKDEAAATGLLKDAAPAVGENHGDIGFDVDVGESNGEDMDMGDAEGGEVDATVRNEDELIKKRTAMDALGNIEKCFATLRDKLFDERLAHYNEELAQLTQPNITHPEYLAVMECIDQRRDDKINYEQTLLRYKLNALEKKSNAEQVQHHSQYMQTVREIRDRVLEQVSKEWYQIQRERRSWEGDAPDYTYKYPIRRSQQITQQTAYNTEVSILSGVAKYVGFPAAPEIGGARPSEVDEDFQSMGIVKQTQSAHHNQPVPHSTKLPTSKFQRPKLAAEEQFLEQNPWANPQHPMHHQNLNPATRHVSHHPRAQSPFTTPAAQRRLINLSALNGSASTIVEAQSGNGSSVAPTPATAEQAQSNSKQTSEDKGNIASYTPSRQNQSIVKQISPAESNAMQTPDSVYDPLRRMSHTALHASDTVVSPTKPQEIVSPLLKAHEAAPQHIRSPNDSTPSLFRIHDYHSSGLVDGPRPVSMPLHPSMPDYNPITSTAAPTQLGAR